MTLQDDVVNLLPSAVQGVFKGERVWVTSRNVAVMDLEDRLLELVQTNDAMNRYIHIEQYRLAAGLTQDAQLATHKAWVDNLDGDIVVFADGAASPSRRAFSGAFAQGSADRVTLGGTPNTPWLPTEYSLGVGLKGDTVVPQAQSLNVVFTLMQQRYLLNSQCGRRGYLNIRVTKAEYDEVLDATGRVGCPFGSPIVLYDALDVPAPDTEARMLKQPAPWLEQTIQDGLKLYGLDRDHMRDIVGIQLTPAYVEKFFHITQSGRPKTLVCVGDAAISHHFWPGRGLNTGLKSAEALFRAWEASGFSLPQSRLHNFNKFMDALRKREIQGRSASMLRPENKLPNIIDEMRPRGDNYAELRAFVDNKARSNWDELGRKAKLWRDKLERRGEAWPHAPLSDAELERQMTRTVRPTTTAAHIMNASGVWPTDQQRGEEVSPARWDWAPVCDP